MKNITFNLAKRILRIALIATLCFTSLANAEKLNPQELAAVIGEINAMTKTDKNLADSFVVKEATTERIERLFAMPEFAAQPTNIRENALIFAGKSQLLSFDKPSDIVNKINSWFPKEAAAAHAKQKLHYFYVILYGPYPSWQDEPAAFLTLWNCMPQVAWLIPATQNPFMGYIDSRMRHNTPFMSTAEFQSDTFDFGRCVREHSSDRQPVVTIKDKKIIEVEPQLYQQDKLSMSKRVTPILQTKFARFLAANRCTKTGADDCVLSLLMWSSLSPDDINLAHALQDLEADIAPDKPLPALQTPSAQNPAGYEPRFDEYLRRAAFLRAKLLSVLSAKQAWKDTALTTTLQQITHLQLLYGEALSTIKDSQQVNERYEIGDHNQELNPKYALSLDVGKMPAAQAMMNAALDTALENIDSEAGCRTIRASLGSDLVARGAFALHHLIDHPFVCDVYPELEWLAQNESEPVQKLRAQYLALLGTRESGTIHELMLYLLTEAYGGCFSQSVKPDWLRKTCSAWVSEPQTASLKLAHSPYILNKAEQFQRISLAGNPNKIGSVVLSPQQDAWLVGLVRGMDASVVKKMQAFAADLWARNVIIEKASLWSHPRHHTALITLDVYGGNEAPVLAISPNSFSQIHLSDRFQDSRTNGGLAYVSDLDNDGNLEMWMGDSSSFCQHDDTDLQRNLYCQSNTAEMGEIYGDTLTYFADTPQPATPLDTSSPLLKNVHPIIEPAREEEQHCNSILIGRVLAKKLKIDFGGGERNRGEIIDLVCKPHPLYPEQIIVALFYDLPKTKNENDLEQKGFALAILDMAGKKVLRIYTDIIEEDASIRVQEFGLHLDTARYNLAPGVRALGVRMNIGYSPRCAEGGESNYLTLFVEEGAQLKPILKNFAMSSWSITEGSNNCGYGDVKYTQESVDYSLSVSDTVSEGWHDLALTSHRSISVYDSTAQDSEQTASTPPKKNSSQVIGKFRAKNKNYSLDTSPLLSKP